MAPATLNFLEFDLEIKMKNIKELTEQIRNVLEDNNYELVEVNIKSHQNPLVEIIIYKEEGITLDDCSDVARLIDSNLNLDDYFKDSYNLEVASPGLDRNLITLDDYRRNKNKKVDIKLYTKVDGEKEFSGELINYNEDEVFLLIDEEEKSFERKNIATMKQYIDFGR